MYHNGENFTPLLSKEKYLSLKHILNAYKHYKVRFDSYLGFKKFGLFLSLYCFIVRDVAFLKLYKNTLYRSCLK